MKNSLARNICLDVLSDNRYILRKITFDCLNKANVWETHSRETYDRENGAVVPLYNKSRSRIILTRQFRMPTYVNRNESGMLIEAYAGHLDNINPMECIKTETEEETGYGIQTTKRVLEA